VWRLPAGFTAKELKEPETPTEKIENITVWSAGNDAADRAVSNVNVAESPRWLIFS
jgi:hypothetical protein